MWHRKICVLASFLSFSFLPILSAQTSARIYQLYGGYSFLSNSFNGHSTSTSHQPLNGWDFGLSAPVRGALAIKLDVSGYYGTSIDYPQRPIFALGGTEYFIPVGKERAFVEGLVGYGHLNHDWWNDFDSHATSSFAAAVGGGLDIPMNPRLAFRVEGDLQYSNFTINNDQLHGLPNYFARITTGIAWRF